MRNYIIQKFSCERKNLKIKGNVYLPKGENLPIAILSHGFMANQGMMKGYAKLMAELGYAAFVFDFNGGGFLSKSSGKTREMSVLTEVEDLMTVMDFAKKFPNVNDEEIVLIGASQGGFVSALTAAQRPLEVSKLILLYPAFCIPDDARSGKMMFAKFDPENIPEKIACGPMMLGRCYPEAVIRMNPFDEIKAYHGPVQIIHGDCDKIVDLSYAMCAVEEMKKDREMDENAGSVELSVIKGGTHMFSKEHDIIAKDIMRKFLTEVN